MPLFSRQRRQAPAGAPVISLDDLLAAIDERIHIAHQVRDPELVDELLDSRYELQTRQAGGTS